MAAIGVRLLATGSVLDGNRVRYQLSCSTSRAELTRSLRGARNGKVGTHEGAVGMGSANVLQQGRSVRCGFGQRRLRLHI